MPTELDRRSIELVERALGLPAPERDGWIERECGADDTLLIRAQGQGAAQPDIPEPLFQQDRRDRRCWRIFLPPTDCEMLLRSLFSLFCGREKRVGIRFRSGVFLQWSSLIISHWPYYTLARFQCFSRGSKAHFFHSLDPVDSVA